MIAQATYQADISEEAQTQLVSKKRDVAYRSWRKYFRSWRMDGSVWTGTRCSCRYLFWTSLNGLSIYYATRDIAANLPDYRLVAPMFLKQVTGNTGRREFIAPGGRPYRAADVRHSL
jgi:hypothetical protein